MNVIIWARVSSREQSEGYSIDAQLRANRERAQHLGLTVVREFAVVESAKQGAERDEFQAMIAWVRAEAKKGKVQGILAHKLDRTCRNMGDAVLLHNLESECGVRLYFCDNHFAAGPAGVFSFNVLAAVGQYYSDNLRTEVLKGMREKVRQGWPMGRASFGYRNVSDRACPVVPQPEQAATVVRIFELFGKGDTTFDGLVTTLAAENRIYRPTMPRFHRTALSWIINNRIYMGEIEHDGKTYPSKVQPLVTREQFNRCQDILHGRNRRTGRPEIPFGGGFFRCAQCGSAMTGEVIRKRLTDGSTREHLYYKCGNEHKPDGHPSVRWRGDHLEARILSDLDGMRFKDPAKAAWLRDAVEAALGQTQQLAAEQRHLIAARLLLAALRGCAHPAVGRRPRCGLLSLRLAHPRLLVPVGCRSQTANASAPTSETEHPRRNAWGVLFHWSGRQDSNLRPPGPKPGALAKLSYAPKRSGMVWWLTATSRAGIGAVGA